MQALDTPIVHLCYKFEYSRTVSLFKEQAHTIPGKIQSQLTRYRIYGWEDSHEMGVMLDALSKKFDQFRKKKKSKLF